MIKAFFDDETGFPKKVFVSLFMAGVLIFASLTLINQYSSISLQNEKAKAQAVTKMDWLRHFDVTAADKLNKQILKPVTEKELEKVQKSQIQILKNNAVKVGSVRQDKPQAINKTALKAVKYEVAVEAEWENLVTALNEFERSNLVVITGLDITPKSTSKNLNVNLEYNIYFK